MTSLAAQTIAYSNELQQTLAQLVHKKSEYALIDIGELDARVGRFFGEAANQVLATHNIAAESVDVIGSHGQTILHAINADPPFTWQIGNPAEIAVTTGIDTVADFRSLDVARGGEGAPLVPPFHAACFGSASISRAIVNIGGIANVSWLNAGDTTPSSGFDTGPGNCLCDDWISHKRGEAFDKEGAWAASGRVSAELLALLMDNNYITQAAPKSTGREHFNLDYILETLANCKPAPNAADVQSTLLQFSVESIAASIKPLAVNSNQPVEVLVCGGGASNTELMRRLARALRPITVSDTNRLGINPDFVEALAFAWLAYSRVTRQPVALTTGAFTDPVVLGGWYQSPGKRQ